MCGFAEGLSAVSAIGAIVQGQQQARQYAKSAAWSDEQAGYYTRKAAWDRARRSEQNVSQLGGLAAQQAGSGTGLSGSALDVMMSNLFLARADEIDGELAGRMNAANATAGAKLSRMQGTQALTSGNFQTGSSLLLGAQNRNWSKP